MRTQQLLKTAKLASLLACLGLPILAKSAPPVFAIAHQSRSLPKPTNQARLSFRFTLAGPVNPSYTYLVAIRVLSPAVGANSLLSDPTQGPSPVVALGSKNGMVGGLPTHYVIYDESSPSLYRLYRFFLKTEQNDASDPAPVNLDMPGQLIGDVYPNCIDPRPHGSSQLYGNRLGFTIDAGYLTQHLLRAGTQILTIEFNILTMNRPARSEDDLKDRVIDAIGDQSEEGTTFTNPIQVNIDTSGTYTDRSSSVPEKKGDTFPKGSNLPAVDITSWELDVTAMSSSNNNNEPLRSPTSPVTKPATPAPKKPK